MSPLSSFRLSNLRPADTGIPNAVLWISAGEFSPDSQAALGPRVVVVPGTLVDITRVLESPVVLISDPPVLIGELPPEVRKAAVEFVGRNQGPLLKHWSGELDTRQVINALVGVEKKRLQEHPQRGTRKGSLMKLPTDLLADDAKLADAIDAFVTDQQTYWRHCREVFWLQRDHEQLADKEAFEAQLEIERALETRQRWMLSAVARWAFEAGRRSR